MKRKDYPLMKRRHDEHLIRSRWLSLMRRREWSLDEKERIII
jgi:hypothetical protein